MEKYIVFSIGVHIGFYPLINEVIMENQEKKQGKKTNGSSVPIFKVLATIFVLGQAYYYYLGGIYFREKMDELGFRAASLDGPISEVYTHSWEAIKVIFSNVDEKNIYSYMEDMLTVSYIISGIFLFIYFVCLLGKCVFSDLLDVNNAKKYANKVTAKLIIIFHKINDYNLYGIRIPKAITYFAIASPMATAAIFFIFAVLVFPLLYIFLFLYVPDAAGKKYVDMYFGNGGKVCTLLSDEESELKGKSKRCDVIRILIDGQPHRCIGETVHSDKKNYYFLTNDRALTIDSKTMNLIVENPYLGSIEKTEKIEVENPEYKDFKWCSPSDISQKKDK